MARRKRTLKAGGAAPKKRAAPATKKRNAVPRKTQQVMNRLMRKKRTAKKTDRGLTTLSSASSNIRRRYTTGIAALDVVLGGTAVSGFTGGRAIEILGDEHVGKSTICCYVMRNVQQQNGITVLYDTEATYTEIRARRLGVDPDAVLYGEEEFLDEILEELPELLHKTDASLPTVIVLDTIAGATTHAEEGKKIGEAAFGSHARIISQTFRKISRQLAKSSALFMCINQRKEGGIGNPYANKRDKDATLGGKAIRFHAQQRLRLRYMRQHLLKSPKTKKLKYYGDEIKATVIKDKERGSDTLACECMLVLAKVGDMAGQFDAALSCFRTLQHWKVFPKKDVRFLGKRWSPEQWKAKYDADSSFAKKADRLMELTAQTIERTSDSKDAEQYLNDVKDGDV